MQAGEKQEKQIGLFRSILFAGLIIAIVSITQNAKADFATPFIGINNNIGNISEAYGYVVAGDSNVENCSAFLVIVTTDTTELAVIRATADKGVVTESLVGRWVFIKAEVTDRQIDPQTKRVKEVRLKILSVKLPDKTTEKVQSVEALFDMKAIKEYISQKDVRYDRTREMFGNAHLPLLYKLLKDDAYAPQWKIIAQVIGFISYDPNSVPVLLDYFQRNDGAKDFSLGGKIWSLAWIGKIGGDLADSVLRKAVTKEGARELAKDWIDEELWQEKYFQENKDRVIPNIQSAALRGLAFSGKKENLDFLTKLYNEHMDTSTKNKARTDLMSPLTDAMAAKDYIADHGIGSFFGIWHSDDGKYIMPYVEKYSFFTRRLKSLSSN